MDGQCITGTGAGIDERGALRVRTQSGVQTLLSGEVSIRIAQNISDEVIN